ncbi:hypothetical protein ACIQ1D_19110 [Lysinibacillus xylanilyticus]|uniref:hypothetical protein n=1 Tax=Lysinibacillus xylanilyticus TaxID=582475 RepID=UPI003825DA44
MSEIIRDFQVGFKVNNKMRSDMIKNDITSKLQMLIMGDPTIERAEALVDVMFSPLIAEIYEYMMKQDDLKKNAEANCKIAIFPYKKDVEGIQVYAYNEGYEGKARLNWGNGEQEDFSITS